MNIKKEVENEYMGSMSFDKQAEHVLSLPVDCPVNGLGGYGPEGEVIYTKHPRGCPSALVDSREGAKASFLSNGSVEFIATAMDGAEIPVLDASFDTVEKREIAVPSQNVWVSLHGSDVACSSLVNPVAVSPLQALSTRVIKIGEPYRQMWFCSRFKYRGMEFETAVKFALVVTGAGPALFRGIFVRNTGKKTMDADLWTYFNMHGTQRFVYNKAIWYDAGMPLTPRESVVSARIPYADIFQIKRISTFTRSAKCLESTCDYSAFAGDTSHSAFLPAAVRNGALGEGAGRRLNRFATPSISASRLKVSIEPGASASAGQSLLYVTDSKLMDAFAKGLIAKRPSYKSIETSFKAAASVLVRNTPGAREISRSSDLRPGSRSAFFDFRASGNRTISEYAGSVWTGVDELYENCRAHGTRLAEGIELGTRDRGQDMWPRMKSDPGRVRQDLVHAFSFMYVTADGKIDTGRRLSLREKLHGMFPRQYPSRWDNRSVEVPNDNRPYADSPLWLINSLVLYVRETGDTSILGERVLTVRLEKPDDPVNSCMTGNSDELRLIDVVFEIFRCFARHVADSPYGLAQVMYGDWCDPVDMFGTSVVGDPETRGRGRGVHLRLSGHLFECLVQVIDLLESSDVQNAAGRAVGDIVGELVLLANTLRHNAIKWAWEEGAGSGGFISAIHELNADGSVPDYEAGEHGYTLGSVEGTDFDGECRRDLAAQAYCMHMLRTRRDYLKEIENGELMVKKMLRCTDSDFFDNKLGLKLFTTPISNNDQAVRLVGRMGVVPSGTAENGEYHHGQVMMHVYRMMIEGEEETAWRQFKPVVSALRDENLCGPFDMPCTSYVSDRDDPHYGKGMYFGLSGSTDWIIALLEQVAGIRLNLHDKTLPDLVVEPRVPEDLGNDLFFVRTLHLRRNSDHYRMIPLKLHVRRSSRDDVPRMLLNGEPCVEECVRDLAEYEALEIEILM